LSHVETALIVKSLRTECVFAGARGPRFNFVHLTHLLTELKVRRLAPGFVSESRVVIHLSRDVLGSKLCVSALLRGAEAPIWRCLKRLRHIIVLSRTWHLPVSLLLRLVVVERRHCERDTFVATKSTVSARSRRRLPSALGDLSALDICAEAVHWRTLLANPKVCA